MQLTPFEALIISHLIADWLFQTLWEAMNKSKNILPLFVHSLVYTAFFMPAFYYYGFKWEYSLILFFSHMILDNRKFEYWWLHQIKRTKNEDVGDALWTILTIGVDQVFHIAILGLLVILS
jgi:hypothetical protein